MSDDERRAFTNRVFFCDIVGFSKLHQVDQFQAQADLSKALRASLARLDADCVRLPTGDGVILNFVTGDPYAHLTIALDTLEALQGGPIGLRIGLNSDVDTLVRDINGNRNVVGVGINTAQRIMDLGQHGQVLMHDRVRSDLQNHPTYFDRVRPLGEFTVKHGERLPVAQFVDPDLTFLSSELLEPKPEAPMLQGLREVMQRRVTAEVHAFEIDPGQADFLPEIGEDLEDFLGQSAEFQTLRYSVSWIVLELLDNALRHGRPPEGERVRVKLGKTARGLMITVSQPDVPGFAFDAVLRDPKHQDSFTQILRRAGFKWAHWRQEGRLEVTIEVPHAPTLGPLAEFASTPKPPAPRAYSGGGLGWNVRSGGGKLVAEPSGRVDETTWEAFSEHLLAAVREAKAAMVPLTLDVSGLDYMSSRGLRALTIARREAGEEVAITIAAPNERMREILAISRYDKLFKVVDAADLD